jgi:hypothetical protein
MKGEGAAGHSLYALATLFYETQDLVELGSKQIERRQDSSVRSEIVPIQPFNAEVTGEGFRKSREIDG